MREMTHKNVNEFIGLSIDGIQFLSIWKFCNRGSLYDVITTGSLNIDWFFMVSLMKDIADVRNFIFIYVLFCTVQAEGRLSLPTYS